MYYTKKEEFIQLLFEIQARHQFFNWKLETRRGCPIRTTCFFMEKQETRRGQIDSTTWFYETKKSWDSFDISEIPKNAHKKSTSQSLSLIAKGTVSKPPIHFSNKPFLKSPHNMI